MKISIRLFWDQKTGRRVNALYYGLSQRCEDLAMLCSGACNAPECGVEICGILTSIGKETALDAPLRQHTLHAAQLSYSE